MDFLHYVFREVHNKRLSKTDAKDLIRQFQVGLGSQKASVLHPLLQQNTSDLAEQRYTSTFTGQEFFLADHVVQGKRVLPGVAYLEMARVAVEQAAGREGDVRLKNLVWAHPITAESEPVHVHIGLFPEENGEIAFEMYGISPTDENEIVVHSQGQAAFGPMAEVPVLDLPALQAQCPPTMSANTIYEAYRSIGIDYGPGHTGIVQLHAGEGRVLAELQLPASVQGSQSEFYLHPSLMDSALQACAALSIAKGEFKPAMPFAISEVELFGGCTSRMWAFIRSNDDKLQTCDIDLCDEEGRVRVRIKGYAVRTIGESAKPAVEQAPAAPAAPVAVAKSDDALQETAIQYFKKVLSESVQIPVDRIEADGSMDKYGLDSIMVMQLTNELEKTFGSLPKTLFFEYQNIRELTGYFLDTYRERLNDLLGDNEPPKAQPQTQPIPSAAPVQQAATVSKRKRKRFGATQTVVDPGSADIAIIGVSGRFPQARNLEEFWTNLREGRDCITEIPKERWDHSAYFDEDKNKPGKTYTKWGGFLDDVDKFDPLFFNISPREAELMDPQERLFLECVYETLEDAGYTRDALQALQGSGMPGNVGVYVGVMYEEYQLYGAQEQALGRPVAIPGNPSSIANRVSYFCNFHGPSMAVDTMCSSSLTAIHLACQSLKRGECEIAIAGGVNVSIHPNKYLFLGQGKFASSNGRCESFGEGGDGYVPGEGVGAVLLKPLDQAIADGDQIYGVIKATSVNHGGHTSGYTVPNPNAQAGVIERALKESGLDPEEISYIEAHGTGTSLGDPIEITGLTKAFRRYTDKKQFCAIGSAKSNIGHCESAAGIAGLSKVLLQFKHGQLAPSLHSKTLNPHIDFENSPFRVQQQLSEWKRPTVETQGVTKEVPRAAGISSFGAGGSNANVIVAEYIPQTTEQSVAASQPSVIVLSAKNKERLLEQAKRLLHAIRQGHVSDADLLNMAYTLQIGREAMSERLAVIVSSLQELQDKLSALVAGDDNLADLYRGQARRNKDSLPLPTGDDLSVKQVIEMWINGHAVDWKKLYEGLQPRRISLPKYPFAKERYWVPEVASSASPIVSKGLSTHSVIHPLLHQNTSNLSEQRFTSHFTGREFFYADSAEAGKRVLAGMAFLEIARAAVEQAAGSSAVQLRDMAWTRPVAEDRPLPVYIGVFPGNNGEILYEIYSQLNEGEENTTIRSQGTAVLGTAGQAPTLDLLALQVGLKPVDRLSGTPEIERLLAGGDRVMAQLTLPTTLAETPSSYVLHPALLGAALQAAVGGTAQTAVPYALEKAEIFSSCPASVYAVIRVAAGKADIDLCDLKGTVCVRIEGLAFHKVDGSTVAETTGRGTLMLKPVWKEQPVGQASGASYSKRFVILCEMDGAVHLDGVQSVVLDSRAEKRETRFQAYASEVFEQIRTILNDKPAGKVLIQIVVPNGVEGHLFTGFHGLLQTAQQENPKLVGQLIAVDPNDGQWVDRLNACSQASDDRWIQYLNGKRLVSKWESVSVDPSQSRMPWKDGGVYLITGGAGGLGLIFAEEIARKARRTTLFLTGRSELSAAKQSRLAELEQLGARIFYKQVDVADKASVNRLILEIEAECGTLQGIIHSAGVNRDNYIIKKTKAELQEVMSPKVAGVVHLDEATRHLRLDVFILFASLAGAFGNPGQADYAFANAFLDGYAAYRNQLVDQNQRFGKTLAIDWPLWKEGGMHVDEAVEKMLEKSMGMIPMRTATGIQALYNSLSSEADQVLVVEGDVERLQQRLLGVAVQTPAATEQQPVAHAERSLLKEKVIHQLKGLLSGVAKLPMHRIDADEPLEAYGIDSVMIAQLNQQLEGVFGELSKTLLFEYQELDSLAVYFVLEHASACERWTGLDKQASVAAEAKTEAKTEVKFEAEPAPSETEFPTLTSFKRGTRSTVVRTVSETEREPIAIIGMSGRYPQSPNLNAFWENLQAGKDCIGEVPSDRWTLEGFFVPDADRAVEERKSYSKWGGFLEGFDQFDPLFFNISPLELLNIDPQERLFLESCWSLLEDAGYTKEQLAAKFGRRVGVFAGITKTGFELYGPYLWKQGETVSPRTSFSSVANRVSYLLNLRGPSLAIDTMCSSSLIAIHEACEHLYRNECEMAIAGGVNLYLHPHNYVELCAHQMLSVDGQCKSFGEGGNGFVPGEGVGTVLLKPLSKAIRDNDRIYALVRGTQTNHGGKTNGYTVPNPVAQGDLIRETLDKAGINARAVSYIEAHGTGTKLGDPIEITGLTQAFQKDTKETGYCSIGSVKSNIGHLEAAAGIAGVAKIVLQMQHGQLVPSLHAKVLNPNINFEKTPFLVQQELSEWKRPLVEENGQMREYPRIAGISSFGAGGSNAHVILEEYIPHEQPSGIAVTPSNPAIVVLSAKNRERLEEYANLLVAAIRSHSYTDADLADIAYTLQVGREAMDERLALICGSIQELEGNLQAFLDGKEPIENVFHGQVKRSQESVSLVSNDEDMLEAVDKWVEKRKFAKFLELWVRGFAFDWNRMYRERKPRRIGLPTYPFAKERYWLPQVKAQSVGQTAVGTTVLHPLLHQNTSDLLQQKFSSVFTGQEFFLTDHVVKGEKVLPGVAYLEMARAAAEQAASFLKDGASIMRLMDVAWLRPVVVQGGSAEVQIGLALEDEDKIAYEISSDPQGNHEEPVLHSRGIIAFLPVADVPAVDLNALRAACSQRTLSAEECYQLFTGMGMQYGPGQRGIETIHVGSNQVLARLTLPAYVAATADSYVLHPSLMDSATQAAIGLLSGASLQKPSLPFALEQMDVFGPCTSAMWAWIRPSEDSRPGHEVQKVDIDLCDDTGKVRVQFRKFATRRLEGELKLRPASAEGDGILTLAPVWNPVLVEKTQASPSWEDRVVVIGGTEENRRAVLGITPKAQHLALTTSDAVADIVRKLQAHGRIDHIVWIAPEEGVQSLAGDGVIAEQEHGVLHGFRLLKALLELGYGEKLLGWTVITTQAQRVHKYDAVHPAHASIHGLIGTMANEHPAWQVRIADLEAGAEWPVADLFFLPQDTQGNALAYRDKEWHEPKLVPIRYGGGEPTQYRHGGVYVVIGGAGGIGEVWSEYMIRTYQAQIVWIGRRPQDAEISAKIARLARFGPAPLYISADATDRESLQQAYRQIKAQHPQIHGVIHSAIVLADKTLSNMEEERFRAGLSAQVEVSVRLAQAFAQEPLDFILFFSAMNAFVKNAGQSNYVAGCTFKDAFAQRLMQERPHAVKIINWGYWGSVGVGASQAIRDRMARAGVGSIEPAEAMAALEQLLSGPIDQIGLVKTTRPLVMEGRP